MVSSPSALERKAPGTQEAQARAALGTPSKQAAPVTPEAVEAPEAEGKAVEASKAVKASETAATGHGEPGNWAALHVMMPLLRCRAIACPCCVAGQDAVMQGNRRRACWHHM
jgi:hypothetical protein